MKIWPAGKRGLSPYEAPYEAGSAPTDSPYFDMKHSGKSLGPGAQMLFGLLFVVVGCFPILAAFDIGPIGTAEINGPPWLAAAAGGVFVAGGLMVMLGEDLPWVRDLLVVSILVGLGAIANWIAFGAGTRACSTSGTLAFFTRDIDLAGMACRIPFGIGGLIVNALGLYMIVAMLQKRLGGTPALARTKKFTGGLLILALLPLVIPLLLPLALFLVLPQAVPAIMTRLKTGRWPEDEAFRQRQSQLMKLLMRLKKSRKPHQV